MRSWPITRVYYNENGHLIIVYAPAWAKDFQPGSDIEGLEEITDGESNGD